MALIIIHDTVHAGLLRPLEASLLAAGKRLSCLFLLVRLLQLHIVVVQPDIGSCLFMPIFPMKLALLLVDRCEQIGVLGLGHKRYRLS